MPEIYAHSRQSGKNISRQTLDEHSSETAELAKQFATCFGCDELGWVLGELHDIGKARASFQSYLKRCDGIEDVEMDFGDHSHFGAVACWLDKHEGSLGKALAYCVAGHHAGLPDWSGGEAPNGALVQRLANDGGALDELAVHDWITHHESEWPKSLHGILKSGTSDSRKDWCAVGGYKCLDNVVGEMETFPAKEVHGEIVKLLAWWKNAEKTLENLLDFHVRFEQIHPFQDGNGCVGWLILLKECLKCGITPFVIAENFRQFYYLGLKDLRQGRRARLMDTCRTGKDVFILGLRKFGHLKHAERAEAEQAAAQATADGSIMV